MKKAKKLAGLLLALVMALALAAPAMATDETGTITLDNPQAYQEYTAYKIFDVVYNADNMAYSYTIDSGSVWFTTVQAYATDANGLTLTQVNGTNTYNVTTTNAFSAAKFADTLKGKVVGGAADPAIVVTGTKLTAAGTSVIATGLELGYYFVSSSSGALCNLTTTNPSVTIHDKNDMPFDKVDDKEDVEIGEVVNYIITGKVPDTSGFATYTYQITDKMSDGLTFNNDVKVFIDGVENTANITLKTGTEAGENDFVLDIKVKELTVGAKIEVKYSATVNENAAGSVENNTAELNYSNNPQNPTDTKPLNPPDPQPTVYSAKIIIDKVVAGANTKLAGAKFVLYKEEEATTKYYKYTAAAGTDPAKVEWVADRAQATEVTTLADGTANFDGLKNGTYYLLETEAPAGYNLLDGPVEIVISGSAADVNTLTHTEQVENSTGAVLPSTGGMGTTIFYVTGSILVLAAVVLLVTKKRMKSAK